MAHMKAEEEQILRQHHGEWGKKVWALGADQWWFHRGFPEEIQLSGHQFMDADFLERVNQVTPLRRLHLGDIADKHVARLAAMPLSKQLRSLEIGIDCTHKGSFGTKGLKLIANSPGLSGLTELCLRSKEITENGVEHLIASTNFKNLESLRLDSPKIDWKGQWSPMLRNFPKLTDLNVNEAWYGQLVAAVRRSQEPTQSRDVRQI